MNITIYGWTTRPIRVPLSELISPLNHRSSNHVAGAPRWAAPPTRLGHQEGESFGEGEHRREVAGRAWHARTATVRYHPDELLLLDSF
jgi:hypothetical protein